MDLSIAETRNGMRLQSEISDQVRQLREVDERIAIALNEKNFVIALNLIGIDWIFLVPFAKEVLLN